MSNTYYKEFKDLFELFDSLFTNGFSNLNEIQPRYNRLISTRDFPPANVVINKDTKELLIEVALAGCSEDNINLSFDADYLKLIVDIPAKAEGEKEDIYYIQRGLKKIQHIETAWIVDPRFYDRENVKVEFIDGLLTIRIFPKEEMRPKKINLFGNYQPAVPSIEEKVE
jgi:HSP20 family molecular chaperone IbpA